MKYFTAAILALSFASFNFPASVKPKNNCSAWEIDKITFGIDSVKAMVFQDTVQALYIHLVNRKKGSKLVGPDYCPLVIFDRVNNDTLATMAINGVPRHFGEARDYPAYELHYWKKKPDLKRTRVSLALFCGDIKVKL